MISIHDFPKIDAHIHFNADRDHLLQLASDYNFSLLTINTEVPEFPSVTRQRELAKKYRDASRSRLFFATTVITDDIFEDNWAENAIAQLTKDISDGACGVKFWKNIGMSIRRPDGSFLMLDDEKLKPVFDYLENNEIPVLGHQGEPKNCWLPIYEMTVKSDREYFGSHPEYHMYKHEECPGYWKHIEARDRILERHPDLKFVGLHLGSLEWNLDEITKRLLQFPNFAIDLAERINHLYGHAAEDHSRVTQFFEQFQDRIIYGTDIIDDPKQSPDQVGSNLQRRWQTHWQFFATDKSLSSPEISRNFRGLNLSKPLLEKIYRTNTLNWYRISDQS